MNKAEELYFLQQERAVRKARTNFYAYCRLTYPQVYRPDRPHLKEMCDLLQGLYERKLLKPDGTPYKGIIMNLPPRHVKSFTVQNFSDWILGRNKLEKIVATSYNETLSQKFGRQVRDVIGTEKADPFITTYGDIFDTQIKAGEGAVTLWAVVGSYMTFLGTSPGGTVTGFGCTVLIIDDLIKNAMESSNDKTLEDHWTYYNDTLKSRKEEGAIEIIIMTRWAMKDLAGRILESEDAGDYYLYSREAYDPQTDTMLCDSLLSKESYLKLKHGDMSDSIFEANYHQRPIDIKGRLYNSFKTYEDVPRDDKGNPLFTKISAYVDTADQGSDYLSSIIYGEYNQEAYALDVYYTKEPMEITEGELARRLVEFRVNECRIESNNGGRGFARAVEKILKEKYNWNATIISWFHQSQNKKARIISNASWVQHHIYLPVNWRDRWREFHLSMISYQRDGKNAHDDAQDAMTGIAENMGGSKWIY